MTSFACLLFYNKDRREQCGTLHRCGVFRQWYLFLSDSVVCRKDFIQNMPLVAIDFGRICSIALFLSAVGVWHKNGVCDVRCHDGSGNRNCVFSKKFFWIFPVSCGIECGFFSAGRIFGNAFDLYGCPAISGERADHFRFHDAMAAFALGLSAVLHTPESRGKMAGMSW